MQIFKINAKLPMSCKFLVPNKNKSDQMEHLDLSFVQGKVAKDWEATSARITMNRAPSIRLG